MTVLLQYHAEHFDNQNQTVKKSQLHKYIYIYAKISAGHYNAAYWLQ